jgi:UDP-N-acetylmuramyl pentapeptide phosphotransferase/UDP-N-acetylglucosamine-1-phosphate transferase
MLKIIGLGLTSLCLSYCGVAILRRWAESRQILDVPNERSSHTRPTPRGGGLAIVIVVLAGWVVYDWLSSDVWPILPYIIGAALIAGISWLDDLRDVPTIVRLVVHVAAAALAIGSFDYWHTKSIPLFLQLNLGWLGLPLTFFWIVGLTNAYNFMDGIDGIAGAQSVVVGLGWALLGWLAGQPHVSAMGMLLAGASLGFLIHNWPPARIFMGDVGSAFLGYTFAVLPLMAAHAPQSDPRLALVGPLLLWPFIFDSALTLLRRALRGENIFAPHRSHLYQRLVIAGHTHLFVTLLYTGLALVGMTLAAVWLRGITGSHVAIATLLPLLCLLLWSYVVRCERRLAARKVSAQVAILSER